MDAVVPARRGVIPVDLAVRVTGWPRRCAGIGCRSARRARSAREEAA